MKDFLSQDNLFQYIGREIINLEGDLMRATDNYDYHDAYVKSEGITYFTMSKVMTFDYSDQINTTKAIEMWSNDI